MYLLRHRIIKRRTQLYQCMCSYVKKKAAGCRPSIIATWSYWTIWKLDNEMCAIEKNFFFSQITKNFQHTRHQSCGRYRIELSFSKNKGLIQWHQFSFCVLALQQPQWVGKAIKFERIGVRPGTIGSHSARKGSATLAASG